MRLSAFACCLHSIGMWNTRSLSFTISLGADSLLEISLHPSPRSKSSTARFLVSTSCLHLRSVRMKNLTKNLTEVFSDKLNRFSEGDCRIRMLAGFTVPVRCRWCRRPRVRGRGGWERVLMSRRRWWNSRVHYGISANVGLHEPGGVREGRIVPVGIV